jgi:UDP:flavonoid glycosyltransferase YjiC (YdhE family)
MWSSPYIMGGLIVIMRLLGRFSYKIFVRLLTGLSTGIPQMVLPMWVDLYDYATRAELLGIGVWGNQKSAPYWTAEELSVSFQKVLGDGETATAIREKAAELGRISKRDPGRFVAARELAKQARLGGRVETL